MAIDQSLMDAVGPHYVSVPTSVPRLRTPALAPALDDMLQGRWHSARERLETHVDATFYDSEEAARFYLALGLCRRFDAVDASGQDQELELAIAAMERAVHLAPGDRHFLRALNEAREHRQGQLLLQRQLETRHRNQRFRPAREPTR